MSHVIDIVIRSLLIRPGIAPVVDVGEKMRAVESEKCYTVTFRAAAEHTGPESVTQKQQARKTREGGGFLSIRSECPVASDVLIAVQNATMAFKRSEGMA